VFTIPVGMSADNAADELFAEARRLETEAVETTEERQELRRRAAALRVQALGPRIYPVLVCQSCFVVTGWTDAAGRCDACIRHAQLRAAFADPHGGWVTMNDLRSPPETAQAHAAHRHLPHLRHPDAVHDRAWLSRVEPDATGPLWPEDEFPIEVAKRGEIDAVDGSAVIIRFSTLTHVYRGHEWVALEKTRIAMHGLLVPAEFSAGLPIVQLAEAWADYRAAVDSFNRNAWTTESAAREAARIARQDHDDTMREQRHVSDLLDEN